MRSHTVESLLRSFRTYNDFRKMDHEALRRELSEPLPHPDWAEVEELCRQVTQWVLRHHRTLPDQGIGQSAGRSALEALLGEPPPEAGQEFARVLADFEHKVAAHAFRVNHPRFAAFVPSAPTFLSILGDWLCAGTNFFAGVWLEAAGPAQVELIVLDWFKQFVGYPGEAGGVLTGGGSEANLLALVTARERLSDEQRRRGVLYVSGQRHWSVDRAAKIMGLRPEQVQPVPVSARYQMEPAALVEHIACDRAAGRFPWAVVANAGATNTGAVDPLLPLADLCRHERLWLHVDAAYGWPAALDPDGRAELAGIDRADSITLDPHKWFGQTFEVGCVLVREGTRLRETFAIRPEYMQDVAPADDEVNFADHGLALTRRFRALKIWLSVKVLGVGWFRRLVRHCCRLADYAQLLLEQAGCFEILSPRQLSIVCFRYRPGSGPAGYDHLDRLNLALVDELRRTQRAFLSSTRLDGRVAIRFCFVNWRTTAADVEEMVQVLAGIGGRLERSRSAH